MLGNGVNLMSSFKAGGGGDMGEEEDANKGKTPEEVYSDI